MTTHLYLGVMNKYFSFCLLIHYFSIMLRQVMYFTQSHAVSATTWMLPRVAQLSLSHQRCTGLARDDVVWLPSYDPPEP